MLFDEKTKFIEYARAEVDGRMWYTVACSNEVSKWIRQQPGEHTQWDSLCDNKWPVFNESFDMHEEFYMMLKLRWGV